MSVFLSESRFAARAIGRRSGFTIAAVLTLALPVATTTLIFSFVDGVLLQPLPYSHPGRLVSVWEVDERASPVQLRNHVSPGNFTDWQRGNSVFDHLAAYIPAMRAGRVDPMRVLREE